MAVRALRRVRAVLAPRHHMREAFTELYERRGWLEPETVSGRGSTLASTRGVRLAIPALARELGVKSVLDAGCGDGHWFREMGLALELYVGVEVVEELARRNRECWGGEGRELVALDITRDALPCVDLIVCRDVLVHLKNHHVLAALGNFARSGSRYLLATTFTGDRERANVDGPLGGWRPIDLRRAPFSLGEPERLVSEADDVEDDRYRDKSLGLWRLRCAVSSGGAAR